MKHLILAAALLAGTEVRGQTYDPSELCPYMGEMGRLVMSGRINGVGMGQFLDKLPPDSKKNDIDYMLEGIIMVAYSDIEYDPYDFALDVELGCYRGLLE
jgi:hypothetical protein